MQPPETPCVEWAGARNSEGYGQKSVGGRLEYVHRLAYMTHHGLTSLPRGHHVDHLCRNHGCLRPDHLELVTHGENIRRGNEYHRANGTGRYGKTKCGRGHSRVVGQECKPCKADSQRARRARTKGRES